MPKDTADSPAPATPYDRPRPKKRESSCTLTLKPRTCFPKKEDGTLDKESGFVSRSWLDGVLSCDVGDGSKEDFWLKTEEALGGVKKIGEKKATRYFLFCLKSCSCGKFHSLKNVKVEVE